GDLVAVIGLVRTTEPRIARELRRQVRRLETVAVDAVPRRPFELIRAAARDEVDAETAGLHVQIVAASIYGDLVEGIEIEVHRGRAARCRVGDDDAVEIPHRIGCECALADKSR